MHPLQPDLTDLTDQELQNKLNEINKRLAQASRFQNWSLTQQLMMLRDGYHAEYTRRSQKQLEEYMKKLGKGWDGVIDIN